MSAHAESVFEHLLIHVLDGTSEDTDVGQGPAKVGARRAFGALLFTTTSSEGVARRPLIHAIDGVAEFGRLKRLNSGGSEHRDVRYDPAKTAKPTLRQTL